MFAGRLRGPFNALGHDTARTAFEPALDNTQGFYKVFGNRVTRTDREK